MTSSRGGDTTGVSKFTAHAAGLLRHFCCNSPYQRSDDAARPLLDDVNLKHFELLKDVIQKTYPSCDIFKIQRVNAPEMYGLYHLHKEEMQLANEGNVVKEMILFHVTSETRAIESLISGLDWRRNQRSRFGAGVSFGINVEYCNYYANQSTNKVGVRVIIVNTVLMNDTYRLTKPSLRKKDSLIPPGTSDTTMSSHGYVFVKFNDYESYPLFFVYYRWTPELLNEMKFFFIKQNYVLQRLQKEDKTLCRQIEDLCITESISPQQLRKQKANLRRRERLRRKKARAEAEAAAAEAAAAPLIQRFRVAAEARPTVAAVELQRIRAGTADADGLVMTAQRK